MGGRGVLEGAARGVLGVRRGFHEVVGFLGVKGVVGDAVVGVFLVGGRRGDRGGIGGAEVVMGAGVDAVVMTEGSGVKVRKIAPRGSCGFRGDSVGFNG